MRLLSPCVYKSTSRVRGILTTDFVVDLQKGYSGLHEFSSLEEGVFATLDDDILTIKRGFKSDLCSPAFRVGGVWVGTHTGPKEAPGAFIHDCTRRVYRLHCVPFTWKDTNDFFWDALHIKKSPLKRTYHFAVSSGIGKLFSWFTEKKLDCYCKTYH